MLSLLLSKRFSQSRQKGFASILNKASTIGVLFGVSVLIVALSVINGFEEQLENRLLSVVSHVTYDAPYEPINDWQTKVTILEQQKGVVAAAPEINLTGMVQFKGKLKAAQIKGIDVKAHQFVSSVGEFVEEFDFSNLQQNQVVLGSQIANSLNLNLGDTFTLLIANKNSKSPLAAPKRLKVTLVGLIKMGGPIDQSMALISLGSLQSVLEFKSDQVTSLRVKVADVFEAHNIAMSAGRSLPDLVYVNSWFRTQGSLYQDIQMVRTIVFLVVILIIAVASFNIVSSMVMEVKDKQSNIAILKTMGAKDRTIFATFAFKGVGNALIGSLIGSTLGVILSLYLPDIFVWFYDEGATNPLSGVYFVEFLPSKLLWSDIAITLSVTVVLALLASIYPAWQATKTDPAKVLGNG
ncbi:MAG: lipoprotein-releasing system transmembrane subunit LolC [Pseudoalteromonas sp.]|nr:lipoprotein-releasing system transmembrane subunit LolC [Pseudoalteromonas sp.]